MLLQTERASSRAADGEDVARVPAAITDTGRERELNEDRYAVIESASGIVWIVCDGMGGATGGELAAQLAIDAMRRDLEALPERAAEVALRSAILEANRVIVLRRQNQAFAAMGTTVVAAMFAEEEVIVAHVGDSRAYLLRGTAIQQLTVDHTYVQELVDRGHIQPDEALSHPQAHVLTRAIGAEPGLEVAFDRYWIWTGDDEEVQDMLLLCTDGLYSLVTEQEIAQIVASVSPQKACVQLVEMANSRGGFDNISVVVIPLPGQLRSEPPPGYERRQQKKTRQRKPEDGEAVNLFGLFRFLFLVLILAILAMLLTTFVMAFRLGG